MEMKYFTVIPVVLLAAVAVSCGRVLEEISVSPIGAATGREGVTITVRGTDFQSSYVIRAGSREIVTHFDSADILSGTLTRFDLNMAVTDPEEKAIDIVVLDGPGGDIISKAAQFWIRKEFHSGRSPALLLSNILLTILRSILRASAPSCSPGWAEPGSVWHGNQ